MPEDPPATSDAFDPAAAEPASSGDEQHTAAAPHGVLFGAEAPAQSTPGTDAGARQAAAASAAAGTSTAAAVVRSSPQTPGHSSAAFATPTHNHPQHQYEPTAQANASPTSLVEGHPSSQTKAVPIPFGVPPGSANVPAAAASPPAAAEDPGEHWTLRVCIESALNLPARLMEGNGGGLYVAAVAGAGAAREIMRTHAVRAVPRAGGNCSAKWLFTQHVSWPVDQQAGGAMLLEVRALSLLHSQTASGGSLMPLADRQL